jgi:hypothetical protein
MTLLALLIAIGAAPPAAVDAGSQAAIEAFREACVQGSLKLSPTRGRILKEREITDFMDVVEGDRAIARKTVVKLVYPASTYLVLVEYKNLQPKSIRSTCALVSSAVSHEAAAGAFLEGLPAYEPRPAWIPNMYLRAWTADHPELGYRKRLRIRDDASVVLQVAMYASASTQSSLEKPKQ